MVDLSAPAQAFSEGGRAQGHHHEFLGIGGLPGGVRAAVEDVHHRNRQHVGIHAANIAVQRQAEGIGSGLGDSQAGAQDRVCAQLGFVGGAVQLDHGGIDGLLLESVPAEQGIGDLGVDVFNSLQHAFAQVAAFVAIAHFKRFVHAGGCAGGNGCPAPAAIRQDHFHFNGGVAARIENFLCNDCFNRCIHRGPLDR